MTLVELNKRRVSSFWQHAERASGRALGRRLERRSQAGTSVLEVKLLKLAQESDKGLKEKGGTCRESGAPLPALQLFNAAPRPSSSPSQPAL